MELATEFVEEWVEVAWELSVKCSQIFSTASYKRNFIDKSNFQEASRVDRCGVRVLDNEGNHLDVKLRLDIQAYLFSEKRTNDQE